MLHRIPGPVRKMGSGSLTYTRSATDAQPVSVEDRLNLWGYTPKDFFQAIDADDTNSIQKAIAAAIADQGVVLLEAKSYSCGDLTATGKVTILGQSWDKTEIVYTGTGNLLTVDSSFYFRLADVRITLPTNARGVKAYGMSGPQIIERCHFYGGSEHIQLTSGTTTSAGCYGWLIKDNTFENAANKALNVYALAAGNALTQAIWIENNNFWGFPQYAIYAGGSSGIWIINNWIERHITATTSAVYLDHSDYVQFSGNYCEDEAPYPFITGAATTHGVVSNNYMSLNVAANVYTNAVVLEDTTGSFWQFTDNTVSHGGTNRVLVSANATRLMVRGNRISVSTLTGSVFESTFLDYDGSDSVSGTTNVYSTLPLQPIAPKAWCRFNSAGVMSDSFGVSSVTKTGTGTYTVNLKASCGNAYPCVQVSGPLISGCRPEVVENGDATKIYIAMRHLSGGTVVDASSVSVVVFA